MNLQNIKKKGGKKLQCNFPLLQSVLVVLWLNLCIVQLWMADIFTNVHCCVQYHRLFYIASVQDAISVIPY